jgi:hypothetical protein
MTIVPFQRQETWIAFGILQTKRRASCIRFFSDPRLLYPLEKATIFWDLTDIWVHRILSP